MIQEAEMSEFKDLKAIENIVTKFFHQYKVTKNEGGLPKQTTIDNYFR